MVSLAAQRLADALVLLFAVVVLKYLPVGDALLLPICDPIIDGYPKGSCLRVSVINDPRFPGDMYGAICLC